MTKLIEINVLSVGEGDLKISFDPTVKADLAQAKKTITSLLKQGFAIMAEVGKNEKGPLLQRVKKFDPKTCEYLVHGDASPMASMPSKKTARLPATTRSYAVARSAGGYNPVLLTRLARSGSAEALNSRVIG